MNDLLHRFRYVIAALVIVAGLVLSYEVHQHSENMDIHVNFLTEVLDRATAHEKVGNVTLKEATRSALSDKVLSYKEYVHLTKLANQLDKQRKIAVFMKGQYRYLDKDGISVNLPKGYIDDSTRRLKENE